MWLKLFNVASSSPLTDYSLRNWTYTCSLMIVLAVAESLVVRGKRSGPEKEPHWTEQLTHGVVALQSCSMPLPPSAHFSTCFSDAVTLEDQLWAVELNYNWTITLLEVILQGRKYMRVGSQTLAHTKTTSEIKYLVHIHDFVYVCIILCAWTCEP